MLLVFNLYHIGFDHKYIVSQNVVRIEIDA